VLAGLFLLVLLASGNAAPASGEDPWGGAGPAWVFVQREVIDSWPGIYHDAQSGACISFDVAFPSVVTPLDAPKSAGSATQAGVSNGIAYHMKITTNKACPDGRQIEVAFFPNAPDDQMPVWNSHADTCGALQYQRVHEFYFGAGRGPAVTARPATDGRLLAKSEVDAVPLGATYQEIRSQLGASSWSDCGPSKGFTAEWTYRARPHWIERAFPFNREQRLVAKH
jgi:hypothetical protein